MNEPLKTTSEGMAGSVSQVCKPGGGAATTRHGHSRPVAVREQNSAWSLEQCDVCHSENLEFGELSPTEDDLIEQMIKCNDCGHRVLDRFAHRERATLAPAKPCAGVSEPVDDQTQTPAACTNCGETNLRWGSFEPNDEADVPPGMSCNVIQQVVTCPTCGRQWTDQFKQFNRVVRTPGIPQPQPPRAAQKHEDPVPLTEEDHPAMNPNDPGPRCSYCGHLINRPQPHPYSYVEACPSCGKDLRGGVPAPPAPDESGPAASPRPPWPEEVYTLPEVCFHCASADLTCGDLTSGEDGELAQTVTCNNCGYRTRDHFRAVRREEMRPSPKWSKTPERPANASGEVPATGETPVDQMSADAVREETRRLFHELWGTAKKAPFYDKSDWSRLQTLLTQYGAPV